MKWKLVGVVMFFAVAILAAVLASGRRSHAQVTNPASTAYAYKVEQFDRRQMKDLERRLNDDGRNGWRVCRVVAKGPSDNTLVVVLEGPPARRRGVCSSGHRQNSN